MGTAMCGARQRRDLVGKATLLAAALLLGPFLCPPAGAQSAAPSSKPAAKDTRAAKRRMPATSKSAATSADAKATRRQAKKIDLARIDPRKIDRSVAMQTDLKRADRRLPNAWIVLGVLQLQGGNFAGGEASLQYAMALGERRRDKAAVARAASLLGLMHHASLGILRADARGAGMFGGRPDDETTGAITSHFERAKALFEKAIGLYKALGRKDGMAAAYAELADLYNTMKDEEKSKAAIEQALALNKAGQRKRQMAANYRTLAAALRYDLDRAAVLLKKAVALDKELGLKEELATDYERLAAITKTRGEPYEAERLYKKALALAPKPDRVSLLRALASLYRDRDDPRRSHEMEEEARTLAREIEKDTGGRMLLFDSSMGVWVSSYDAKMQVESLEKVLPMEKVLGNRIGQATSYILLGHHYGQRADIYKDRRAELQARAEAMFKNAVALNKRLGRDEATLHAYHELVLILNKRGKYDKVQAALKDALALSKKRGESIAKLYWNLGYDRQEQADTAQACAYWRQGAKLYPNDKRLVDSLNRNKCASIQ